MLTEILAFMVLAHPAMFKLTSSYLGPWIADYQGIPTVLGLLLHAIVFMFVIKIMTFLYALVLLLFGRLLIKSKFESRENEDDQNKDRFIGNRFLVT